MLGLYDSNILKLFCAKRKTQMWVTRNIWDHNSILWPQSFPLPGVPKMAAGILVIKTELLWGQGAGRQGSQKGMSSGNHVFSGFFSSERQVPFKDTRPIQDVGCMERRETGNQSGDGGKGRGSKRIYEAAWRLSRDPGRWRGLSSEVRCIQTSAP